MAWTNPKTWTSILVTVADMNTHVRDNLNALKAPPADQWDGELTDTITSATWADVDATNLALTITTTGGAVWVSYIGNTANHRLTALDLDVDGARYTANTYGFLRSESGSTGYYNMSFAIRITGLSAAAHTIKLQFRGDGSNANSLISHHFSAVEGL